MAKGSEGILERGNKRLCWRCFVIAQRPGYERSQCVCVPSSQCRRHEGTSLGSPLHPYSGEQELGVGSQWLQNRCRSSFLWGWSHESSRQLRQAQLHPEFDIPLTQGFAMAVAGSIHPTACFCK